jgi:hypothetical protein
MEGITIVGCRAFQRKKVIRLIFTSKKTLCISTVSAGISCEIFVDSLFLERHEPHHRPFAGGRVSGTHACLHGATESQIVHVFVCKHEVCADCSGLAQSIIFMAHKTARRPRRKRLWSGEGKLQCFRVL